MQLYRVRVIFELNVPFILLFQGKKLRKITVPDNTFTQVKELNHKILIFIIIL